MVNLTSSSHGIHSFILKPGDHPWIYKDSDVNFGDALLTTEERVQIYVRSRKAIPHSPMEMAIVIRVVETAKTHPAFAPKYRKYLD